MTLEQFILANLDELNQSEPSAKIWQQVSQQLDEDALVNFIQKNRQQLDTEFPNHTLWEKLELALEQLPSKSPIEYFIGEHTEAFDSDAPPTGLWDKISADLDEFQQETQSAKIVEMPKREEKKVSVRVLWQVAASLLLLMVSGMIFQNWYLNQQNEIAEQSDLPSFEQQIAEMAPELLEAEKYYASQISLKLGQIRKMDLTGTGIEKEDFEEEIGRLGTAYTQMKSDLIDSDANERVLNAMVENLQLRMELLNRQLQILEKVKQIKENKNNEIQI